MTRMCGLLSAMLSKHGRDQAVAVCKSLTCDLLQTYEPSTATPSGLFSSFWRTRTSRYNERLVPRWEILPSTVRTPPATFRGATPSDANTNVQRITRF